MLHHHFISQQSFRTLAVVATGAVVTHSVDSYSIVAGVPAKKIGMRFSEQEIIEHEEILYWIIPVLQKLKNNKYLHREVPFPTHKENRTSHSKKTKIAWKSDDLHAIYISNTLIISIYCTYSKTTLTDFLCIRTEWCIYVKLATLNLTEHRCVNL